MISKAARIHGLPSATVLAIARCESEIRQFNNDGSLLRGRTTPRDVGIFQINEGYHLEKSRQLGFDIYTTEGNIAYAMWLMKEEGTKHWNWSKNCWGQQV